MEPLRSPIPIPLSAKTEVQMGALYRVEHHDAVRAMLLEYGVGASQGVVERVRYDILHLAEGDPAKVRSLVDMAKQDSRDVMAAEYFREDGIAKPHKWAMVHQVNRKLQARIDAGEPEPYLPVRQRDRDQ
jgi:hypothetical protein